MFHLLVFWNWFITEGTRTGIPFKTFVSYLVSIEWHSNLVLSDFDGRKHLQRGFFGSRSIGLSYSVDVLLRTLLKVHSFRKTRTSH